MAVAPLRRRGVHGERGPSQVMVSLAVWRRRVSALSLAGGGCACGRGSVGRAAPPWTAPRRFVAPLRSLCPPARRPFSSSSQAAASAASRPPPPPPSLSASPGGSSSSVRVGSPFSVCVRCWACGDPLPSAPSLYCPACGVPQQSALDIDYFALLSVSAVRPQRTCALHAVLTFRPVCVRPPLCAVRARSPCPSRC